MVERARIRMAKLTQQTRAKTSLRPCNCVSASFCLSELTIVGAGAGCEFMSLLLLLCKPHKRSDIPRRRPHPSGEVLSSLLVYYHEPVPKSLPQTLRRGHYSSS